MRDIHREGYIQEGIYIGEGCIWGKTYIRKDVNREAYTQGGIYTRRDIHREGYT